MASQVGSGAASLAANSRGPDDVVVRSTRAQLGFVALMSGVINILMLAGSLFMLQVYDRVIPSRSVPTLVALVLLVVVLYTFTALLEAMRSRLLARTGQFVDDMLGPEVFRANVQRGLLSQRSNQSPFRDLEQIRSFLAGGGPPAIMDLPWTPLYLALLFVLHPWLGALGLIGIGILAGLTWMTERRTAPIQRGTAEATALAALLADTSVKAAETIVPLGMSAHLQQRWRSLNVQASRGVVAGSDVAGVFGGASRFVRMSLQSVVLAVGAYLVITGRATGGVMIGSSILFGRALAPVEAAIAHWRAFASARQAYGRLTESLGDLREESSLRLPPPSQKLSIENLVLTAPGSGAVLVREVGFEVMAGDAIGVIGPSGAGKSSIARAVAGALAPARGAIRFDGAALDQWSEQDRGAFLGYLPQDVDLIDGTVGENIARFDPTATSEEILAAATGAGVDGFIRELPEGYDTAVGPRGARFSAGQRQRLALARALFREPAVLILDEPNSALDAEGDAALSRAIFNVRQRGGMVLIVAHRPSALQAVNKVLLLAKGRQQAFGPRDEVLGRATAARTAGPAAQDQPS